MDRVARISNLEDKKASYTKVILHIDMDAFFVSVERALNPELLGKPVIVGGDPKKRRGVVASASYETRVYGVKSGMPLAQARRLCPHAIVIIVKHNKYLEYSEKIRRLLEGYSPLVEMASVDEAYIDLTGGERLLGSPFYVAEQIQKRIKSELNLPCSIGIASSKIVAKIASDCAKPQGILRVLPNREKEFLAPLAIEKLPGVGPHTAQRLRLYGVKTVGDMQRLGEKELVISFGEMGRILYHHSVGDDDSQVVPEWCPKSVGRSTTLPYDLSDIDTACSVLSHLCEQVGQELRNLGALAHTITLKIRYADFRATSSSQTISEPTNFDSQLFQTIRDIFLKVYKGRKAFRLLGVSASKLIYNQYQLNWLTQQRMEKLRRLYRSIDKIKERYGVTSLLSARSLLSI